LHTSCTLQRRKINMQTGAPCISITS
jgi:hypothetical protein